jgi:hypothetical protein
MFVGVGGCLRSYYKNHNANYKLICVYDIKYSDGFKSLFTKHKYFCRVSLLFSHPSPILANLLQISNFNIFKSSGYAYVFFGTKKLAYTGYTFYPMLIPTRCCTEKPASRRTEVTTLVQSRPLPSNAMRDWA